MAQRQHWRTPCWWGPPGCGWRGAGWDCAAARRLVCRLHEAWGGGGRPPESPLLLCQVWGRGGASALGVILFNQRSTLVATVAGLVLEVSEGAVGFSAWTSGLESPGEDPGALRVGSFLWPHLLFLASRLSTSTRWSTRPSTSSLARGESWRWSPEEEPVCPPAVWPPAPTHPHINSLPGGPGSCWCGKTGLAGMSAPGPPSQWRMR